MIFLLLPLSRKELEILRASLGKFLPLFTEKINPLIFHHVKKPCFYSVVYWP